MRKTVKWFAAFAAMALVFGATSCEDPESDEPVENPKAVVKFVANMMGSASAEETAEGNFATKDAMSEDSYIDNDGAIHGTFKPIANSEFTAFWGEGQTGKSYYARYDINVPALTAEDEGSTGTYIFYIKTSCKNGVEKTEYGTSKSRAKCTVLGDSAEDAKKLKIDYYVLEGVYTKVYNTVIENVVALPEAYKTLLMDKKPAATITVASDAVFKTAE